VLATTGSLGDLHPFLAIGMALAHRGHTVSVATTQRYASPVQQAGLDFTPMRPDPPDDPAFHERFMHPKHGAKFAFREYLAPAIHDSYADLYAACKDADLLISQSMALAAPLVAEAQRLKWLSCVFQPFTLFSAYDPPLLPPLPLRRGGSREAVAWNERILDYSRNWTRRWVAPVDEARRTLQLPEGGHPIYEGQHSPHGVLALFSPLLGTPQPDWPQPVTQTGMILYRQPNVSVPEGLSDFLKHGEPPLVFTLGSSSAKDAQRFFSKSLTSAEKLARRAVFLTGSTQRPADLPEMLPEWATWHAYAPYPDVFPYAAAVIHGGGMGSIMAALAAGVPQLAVTYAHDQHDNARRMQAAGAGIALRRNQYSPRRAAHSIAALINDPSYAAKAGNAQELLENESGVEVACDHIETQLRNV